MNIINHKCKIENSTNVSNLNLKRIDKDSDVKKIIRKENVSEENGKLNNQILKKEIKFNKSKIKKIKKRCQKRDSNLYDINNFVVQNNSNKINEKKDFFDIPIPIFKELDENFYENCNEINSEYININSYLNELNVKFDFNFNKI